MASICKKNIKKERKNLNALQYNNDYINCEFIHTVKFYVTDKRQKERARSICLHKKDHQSIAESKKAS